MSYFEKIFPLKLSDLLRTETLGRSVLAKDILASTNTTASEMAKADIPEGLVVVADAQTSGLGRNGRSWFSPPGRNLYFSLLLRPHCQPGIVPQLAIVAALSLRSALHELCPAAPICVKWPNDLLCNESKLSGILCTMSCSGANVEYAVVGIGVNVNIAPDEFPAEVNATSLQCLKGAPLDREQVLASFLNTFEADYRTWLAEGNLAPFIPRWNECSCLENKYVEVEQGKALVSGIVKGITPEGHLRLRDASGSISLAYAGDAHIRRR